MYVPILTQFITLMIYLFFSDAILNYVEDRFYSQLPVPQLVLYSDEDQIADSKYVPEYVDKQRKLGRDITVVFN